VTRQGVGRVAFCVTRRWEVLQRGLVEELRSFWGRTYVILRHEAVHFVPKRHVPLLSQSELIEQFSSLS